MDTKFIRIDFNNNPAKNSETEEHRKAIELQQKKISLTQDTSL